MYFNPLYFVKGNVFYLCGKIFLMKYIHQQRFEGCLGAFLWNKRRVVESGEFETWHVSCSNQPEKRLSLQVTGNRAEPIALRHAMSDCARKRVGLETWHVSCTNQPEKCLNLQANGNRAEPIAFRHAMSCLSSELIRWQEAVG